MSLLKTTNAVFSTHFDPPDPVPPPGVDAYGQSLWVLAGTAAVALSGTQVMLIWSWEAMESAYPVYKDGTVFEGS